MKQQTLADSSFEKFRKKTRKEQFLEEMEVIIPWEQLTEAIEPFYPNPQNPILASFFSDLLCDSLLNFDTGLFVGDYLLKIIKPRM